MKLDQSVCYSMASHERNVKLVSQIETTQIISRPVTILRSCFLLVVTEAKQEQTKSVTSSLLGWKCRCGLIVLLEISDLALHWRMLDLEATFCEFIIPLVG